MVKLERHARRRTPGGGMRARSLRAMLTGLCGKSWRQKYLPSDGHYTWGYSSSNRDAGEPSRLRLHRYLSLLLFYSPPFFYPKSVGTSKRSFIDKFEVSFFSHQLLRWPVIEMRRWRFKDVYSASKVQRFIAISAGGALQICKNVNGVNSITESRCKTIALWRNCE